MPSSVPVGGMRMSVTTRSGDSASMSASRVGRSAAVPTSSMSSARSSSCAMPSRSSVLSSASTTRIPTAAQDTAGPPSTGQRSVCGAPRGRRCGRTCRARRRRAASTPSTGTAAGSDVRYGWTPGPRAEQQLQAAVGAAGDVAADDVLVVGLVPAAVGDVPGQHDVAEARVRSARSGPRWRRSCRAWSAPARGSRSRACAGPRAPGWGRTGSAGRPARTAGRGDARPATSASASAISRSVPAEVQRSRPPRVGVRPRHRLGQRVVDLEHAGAVAERAAGGAGSRSGARRRRCAAAAAA